MTARVLVGVVFALAVLLPAVATACPVCNAYGEEESRVAFILTTVFLSGLPVAMIAVGAWLIWRRIRAAEQAPRPERTRATRPARVGRSSTRPTPAA